MMKNVEFAEHAGLKIPNQKVQITNLHQRLLPDRHHLIQNTEPYVKQIKLCQPPIFSHL